MKIRGVKINNYLAIALISILGTAFLALQLSSNIFPVPDLLHDQHTAEAASLPLAVDFHSELKERVGDAKTGTSYVKFDEDFIDSENHCEFCTRIEIVSGPKGGSGIAYVLDKVLDFSNAKSVTFFAMGEEGGEKVKFKIAGKKLGEQDPIPTSGLFKEHKFALTTNEVILNKEWRKYSVDLTGADLNGITHPFGMEVSPSKAVGKQVFYIKYIVYDSDNAVDLGLTAVQ
jgi:hypothetical protein